MKRGYCGIGIYQPKDKDNMGGLIRSAHAFRADFIFTVGNRYSKQVTDTSDGGRHMPIFHYPDVEDFVLHLPKDSTLIGMELLPNAQWLQYFKHPKRAVYILGGEDRTLPGEVTKHCATLVQVNTQICLNVASAATVLLYDRDSKK